jgi:hypothetical protein
MARRKWLILAVLITLVATVGISGSNRPAAAQVSADPAFMVRACSETDYTKVTADTLGMTTSELRLALVSGKTVQDLAAAQDMPLQTVVDGYAAALDNDIVAAVSDGLVSAQQANVIRTQINIFPGAQLAGLNVPADTVGGISPVLGQGTLWGGMTLYSYTSVKPLLIASKAMDLKCADLIKQAQPNKAVILLAAQKNARIQDLIDGLVNAYRGALDQDVKDGLMTSAQADGQKVRLLERVVTQISQPGLMVPRIAATPVTRTVRPLPTLPRPTSTPAR